MTKAIKVAKLFLSWANENGDVITNLKMQKLLYYAQAWYLVNHNKRLFEDPIEAWEFGPVVRSVYGSYRDFKAAPIAYNSTGKEEQTFEPHQIRFLREFFKVFSSLSATALVSMTHSEAPWKDAYRRSSDHVIDPTQMREFYKKQYQDEYASEA